MKVRRSPKDAQNAVHAQDNTQCITDSNDLPLKDDTEYQALHTEEVSRIP